MLSRIAHEEDRSFDVPLMLREEDALIKHTARWLFEELSAETPPTRLLWSTAGVTLAMRLLRSRAPANTSYRGGLAPWQVRRMTEYLHAHLADDLPLATLAELVGLSSNHFCTAFRISLGEPPHRYLVRLRLRRAKELLFDRSLSITDVALAVGFSSSAHFATAFRKQVGASPSAYRRECVW
jgi:AraC family transcriptional regulator